MVTPMKSPKLTFGKYARLICTALIVGFILTVASLGVPRSGTQMYCAPPNPGPLDELGAAIRHERGMPWTYYTDPIPQNCMSAAITPQSVNYKPDSTGIKWASAFADIIVWSGATFMVLRLISRRKS